MSGREFLDTNVLVYAHDTRDPHKHAVASDLVRRLLHEGRGVLSMQVLQEYYSAVTRKLGMARAEARRRVELYLRFDVVTLQPPDLLAAIDLHRRHGLSIWDGLIVRAALNASCTTLHSEDLQPGYTIDQLTIRSPFSGPDQESAP